MPLMKKPKLLVATHITSAGRGIKTQGLGGRSEMVSMESGGQSSFLQAISGFKGKNNQFELCQAANWQLLLYAEISVKGNHHY